MTYATVHMNESNVPAASSEAYPPKPMSFWLSLVVFAVPALVFFIAVHVFIPLLERLGLAPLVSFLTALTVPLSWLFVAALVAYHKMEGRPLTVMSFASRMRFPRLTLRDVLWALLIFAVGGVGLYLMTPIRNALLGIGLIQLPASIPLLIDPRAQISPSALDRFVGGPLLGRWDILILYAVNLFFNIAGEELWWRGYILPRQELVHGRWTWLIHGLMWAGFHAFKYWDIIVILPLALAIAYGAQRLKSNWAPTIAHLLGNLSFFLIIAAGVIGLN